VNFGSLFAGIGGFDLGFERAGMECRWQVEIDARCNDVLARHWPDVKRYKDVRDAGRENLEPVDVICGGFPCQDLSVAGRREGLAGERSGLWYEFIRVVEEIKPEWVIVENVPGLLSSYSGDDPPDDLQPGREWETTEESDLAIILRGLGECGYWWAYRVLDAQYFGVAQRRRRVFIVGSLGNGRAAQILFEREGSAGDTAPSREAGQGIADPAQNSIGIDCEQNTDIEMIGSIRSHQSGGSELMVGTFQNTGHGWWNETPVAQSIRTPEGGGSMEANVIAFTERTRDDGRNVEWQEDVAYALDNPGEGGRTQTRMIAHAPAISPALRCEGHDASEDGNGRRAFVASVAPTLQKDSYSPMKSSTGQQLDWCIGQDYGVRRLTPTECERLQGFPDGWTAGQSDSARYRQLGNAVAVPVAEWIGRRIVECDR